MMTGLKRLMFVLLMTATAAAPAFAVEQQELKAAAEMLREQKIRVKEVVPVAVVRLAPYEKRGVLLGITGAYKCFEKKIPAKLEENFSKDRFVQITLGGMASESLPIILNTRARANLVMRLAGMKEEDRILLIGKIKIVRPKGRTRGEEVERIPVFEVENFLQLPALPEPEEKAEDDDDGITVEDSRSTGKKKKKKTKAVVEGEEIEAEPPVKKDAPAADEPEKAENNAEEKPAAPAAAAAADRPRSGGAGAGDPLFRPQERPGLLPQSEDHGGRVQLRLYHPHQPDLPVQYF